MKASDAATLKARSAAARRGERPSPSTLPSLAAPKPKGEPERAEQVALARWLDSAFDGLWCHVPNERSSARQAGRLAQAGVKPGVPDVLIFRRTQDGAPGCAVELKAPSRRAAANPTAGTSPEQRAWLAALAQEGWMTAVCYSAAEARLFIESMYFER
jgi:hypothetical protein